VTNPTRLETTARLALAVVVIFVAACESDRDGSRGDPARAVEDVTFVDRASEAGLTLATVCGNTAKTHLLESTGTGVAVGDYDGDGDDDLYVTTAQTTDDWLAGRKPRANALYRNDGDGTFIDVAREAGVALAEWSAGAYFADYDNDSDPDLFVTAWGPNVLYRNDGDGTFTDVTATAGVAGDEHAWSASAAFGDLDGDSDLDLYVTNYCTYDLRNPPFGDSKSIWMGMATYPGPRGFTAQPDVLYRNDGDGTFTDWSRDSGLHDSAPRYGLGVVMSDLDDDRDLDIFVANDSMPNFLFRNEGGLRFSEVAAYANVATNEDAKEQAGMGTDAGDFDGDGRPDVIVTNFSHDFDTLHRNMGELYFTDATFEAGLRDSFLDLAWGVKFFDYDNDCRLDLIVANGHIYPEVDGEARLNTRYEQRNRLYRNRGGGVLQNRSRDAGPGLAAEHSARGVAVVDVERDGDLDVVVTNIDATPTLLVNQGGNRAAWLSLDLRGVDSNRDAIGARVTLETPGAAQVRELNPFGSYLSQSAHAMHFGLGAAGAATRVVVEWPSGRSEELLDLPADRFYVITEGKGITSSTAPAAAPSP